MTSAMSSRAGDGRSRRRKETSPSPAFRPGLERLEDRIVPDAGDLLWQSRFGGEGAGTVSPDEAAAVACDPSDGSAYVVGYTNGSLDGTNAGSADAFLRKYDGDGQVLWTRQFGTAGVDRAQAVAVDGMGNVYVAGTVFGALSGETHAGNLDAFALKLDADGTVLWTEQFGTPGEDQVHALSLDAAGNVYAAGTVYGALPGEAHAGNLDAFVRKLDAGGGEVWTSQFGTTEPDHAYGVSVDGLGNVYVVGSTKGTLQAGYTDADGWYDAFVRKLDAGGGEVWTSQFGRNEDAAWAVGVDGQGHVYVAGDTGDTLPGQVSAGSVDAFLRKYDGSGRVLWDRQFGSFGYYLGEHDSARSLCVDDWGEVYVVGFVGGALPGQSVAGAIDAFVRKYTGSGTEVWSRQFGSSGEYRALAASVDGSGHLVVAGYGPVIGDLDAFVRKYDGADTSVDVQPLWQRLLGTAGTDAVTGLSVDGAGNVHVAGWTTGDLDGTSAGDRDAYVRRYDQSGSVLWTRQFGTTGLDDAEGVGTDASGNVYVVGSTFGSLAGPNAGSVDAYVRKYDGLGNLLWTRQWGTDGPDSANGLSVDGAGNVYVAGHTSGSLEGTSAGSFDAYVRKFDSSGAEIWTRQFGTGEIDHGRAVGVDGAGNVYVGGSTQGSLGGPHAGYQDAYVRKYDRGGSVLWTRQFALDDRDYVNGLSVDGSGNVYVAGETWVVGGGSLMPSSASMTVTATRRGPAGSAPARRTTPRRASASIPRVMSSWPAPSGMLTAGRNPPTPSCASTTATGMWSGTPSSVPTARTPPWAWAWTTRASSTRPARPAATTPGPRTRTSS